MRCEVDVLAETVAAIEPKFVPEPGVTLSHEALELIFHEVLEVIENCFAAAE